MARLVASELTAAAAAAATDPYPIPATEPSGVDSANDDLRVVVVVDELQ